ncbi:LytR C-terminal domain-containing protein [Streptomyces cavernicola]|uniref:LytR C-terminal domain-containing protein n=1 Tax=Streptomyces cavernicola TaxID=3043613 RepID=A0ABT6S3G7_9ACTN|nr:LytR C-terminal domain-containing protein [Streptomyces sp. B-S-A6]MDI3402644.1 LytR C-terminal domain-containing protein [Streptomyces sp. B-S-A6]
MSMLTPPGMGGEYRITGDKYPRMRRNRHRRTVLAVIASAAALGLVGWGVVQLVDVFSGSEKRGAVAADRPDCKPAPKPSPSPKALPKPGQIKVNVLNATPRTGLAKKTADELKKRGFTIGEVGNATKEYDKKVEAAAVLLGPKSALKSGLPVLGTQLAGAERKTDGRKGEEIDFIIGKAFKSLAKKEDAEKALTKLAEPAPTPSRGNC